MLFKNKKPDGSLGVNDLVLRGLDYTLDEARKRGIKVISWLVLDKAM